MNADRLIRGRRGPWVGLRNAVDCPVQDIDEFAHPGVERINTENLCVRILKSGTRGSAHPVVLSDDNWKVCDRVAVWRAAKVVRHTCGLVIRADLISVEKVDDVGIDG